MRSLGRHHFKLTLGNAPTFNRRPGQLFEETFTLLKFFLNGSHSYLWCYDRIYSWHLKEVEAYATVTAVLIPRKTRLLFCATLGVCVMFEAVFRPVPLLHYLSSSSLAAWGTFRHSAIRQWQWGRSVRVFNTDAWSFLLFSCNFLGILRRPSLCS